MGVFRIIFLSGLFACCSAPIISAQTEADSLVCNDAGCCLVNAPPAGIMFSHVHSRGEWMLSYRYMKMNMEGLRSGTEDVGLDQVFQSYLMAPRSMEMDMHMLMLMYGISKRATLMAMGNYNINRMEMEMFAGSHDHGAGEINVETAHKMNSSGWGDTKLYLLFDLLSTPHHRITPGTGLSLPTGSIKIGGLPEDMMYSGKRYPYAMQTGTGTWDWVSALCYIFQKKKTTIGNQVLSTIRTGYNYLGYKWGNEFAMNNWIAYRGAEFLSISLRAESSVSGRIKGHVNELFRYMEPSANPVNYGGRKVMIFGGITISPVRGFWQNLQLAVEYGLPVFHFADGIQMKSTSYLNVSLSVTIN
ncbi:MAG: transporter [Crocinitomicaceae bacterium]|nr:transporter [Crocinitomicaceae bacterium]